jgi:Zinc knuckle
MDELTTVLESIKTHHEAVRKSRSDIWSKDRRARYLIKTEDLHELLRHAVRKTKEVDQEKIKKAYNRLSETATILQNVKLSAKQQEEQGLQAISEEEKEKEQTEEFFINLEDQKEEQEEERRRIQREEFRREQDRQKAELEKQEEQERKNEAEEEEEDQGEKEEEEKDQEEEKMAVFNLKEARGIPELKDINNDTAVRDFLANVKFYYDDLKVENQPVSAAQKKLLNFVLTCKVTNEAKTKIGNSDVDNFPALSALLHEKCGSSQTRATITKAINETKQGSQSVESFAEKISQLGDRLAAIEIRENATGNVNEELIKNIYEKQIITAFKKGLNPTLQAAVCAARPKTLTDAIQVASEIEAIEPENKPVHFMKKDVLCKNCNKKGHYASDCRTKITRQPQNRGNTIRGRFTSTYNNQNRQFSNQNYRYNNYNKNAYHGQNYYRGQQSRYPRAQNFYRGNTRRGYQNSRVRVMSVEQGTLNEPYQPFNSQPSCSNVQPAAPQNRQICHQTKMLGFPTQQ